MEGVPSAACSVQPVRSMSLPVLLYSSIHSSVGEAGRAHPGDFGDDYVQGRGAGRSPSVDWPGDDEQYDQQGYECDQWRASTPHSAPPYSLSHNSAK